MRRFTTAMTAAALALSLALGLTSGSVQALTPGYDSAYQFESAFLSLKAGDSGTFSVFFANTGTTSWVTGAGTQVNLAVCDSSKVTCNVASPNAAWASGWLSATAYATQNEATESVTLAMVLSLALLLIAGGWFGKARDWTFAATGKHGASSSGAAAGSSSSAAPAGSGGSV